MALLLTRNGIENFVVNTLSTDQDVEQYRNLLEYFPKNPTYSKELISFGKSHGEELMYFLLLDNGFPVVLMPFLIRKIFINGNDTGLTDVSSPYGYSGPLFANNAEKGTIMHFWKQIDEWYKRNNVVAEFIRFNLQGNWKGYNGIIEPTLVTVCGKVLPEEEQWNNFKPKVRNNYRKSITYGLKSTIYHDNITLDIIKQFHEIYLGTMERNHANQQYFYELKYFVNLITNNPDMCAIMMIYMDGIPVSTELLLLTATTIISFLGGTVMEYFHTRPNDFLKIEVLRWAREKGYAYYSLGGGRENNDTLYQYKKNFFPMDEDPIFYTGRKIVDEKNYNHLVKGCHYCVDCNSENFFPLYRCK